MGSPKQAIGTLAEIVEPMREEARRLGSATPRRIDDQDQDVPRFTSRGLVRGLVVSLSFDDPGWTLIIARNEIAPTAHDVAVICNAFDVPCDARVFAFERAGIHSVCVEWGKELTREVGS